MRKKKPFYFKENIYKQDLANVYPYYVVNGEYSEVFIEICQILAIEVEYQYRKPKKFEVVFNTQTHRQIVILQHDEYLDIINFFPAPKQLDEVIAIFSRIKNDWILNGMRPVSECQFLYDYIIKNGPNDISSKLSHKIDPFDFPITSSGKRISIFQFAVENKIEWLVNFLIGKKELYQDVAKDHCVEFRLADYLLKHELWDLFSYMIVHNKYAVKYFSNYSEKIIEKLGENNLARLFQNQIDKTNKNV